VRCEPGRRPFDYKERECRQHSFVAAAFTPSRSQLPSWLRCWRRQAPALPYTPPPIKHVWVIDLENENLQLLVRSHWS
jgi:hypothetical protein